MGDPPSKNIGEWTSPNYLITAASWESLGGMFGPSYEIGIRDRKTGQFWLLQSRKWHHQSVQEVANAIAHILSIPTEFYTPEWFQEYFT